MADPDPPGTDSAPREELRVAEALLPFLLLSSMEWKSYKSGAQNTSVDREPQPVTLWLLPCTIVLTQEVKGAAHTSKEPYASLALSSDNAHNASNSKTKLPFVTTWEAQSPKIKLVLQKRHPGISLNWGPQENFLSACIVTRLPQA